MAKRKALPPVPANPRALSAQILDRLLQQNGSLTGLLAPLKSRDDFPLLQEMCFGSCRWFYTLDWILLQVLSKPLKKKDQDVRCLLLIGLYQLRYMSVPDYAVINETVNASKALKKPWSRSLINAVLRNYLRQADDLGQKLESAPISLRAAQPQWLVDQINTDWPEQAQSYFEASNNRPPMVLRVNQSKLPQSDYLEMLSEANIKGYPGHLSPSAIYLESPMAVFDLPGFEEGLASVQDESSQLIPNLLQLKANQTVLDACAAPGGKTCHILESESLLTSLTAIDLAAHRVGRIHENLTRLGLTANVVVSDVSDLEAWWDGEPFDRILLDAPCSATGIIRRHPDIKVLRTPENVLELNEIQLQLLKSVWKCLKPNGLLLYTTCSVLRSENEQIVDKFLQCTQDAKYEGIAADWGVECAFGRQLLPTAADGPDGFFFSLLRKDSELASPPTS